MIKHREFPINDSLPNLGNFIRPGQDGVVCIGRGVFFDDCLLRDPKSTTAPPNTLLSNYNLRTRLSTSSAAVGDHKQDIHWSIGGLNPARTAWSYSLDHWAWGAIGVDGDEDSVWTGQYPPLKQD